MKKTTQKTRKQLRDELKKAQEAIDGLNTLNRGLQYTIQNEQAKNKVLKDSLKVYVDVAKSVDRDITVAVRVSGDMLRLFGFSTEAVMEQAYTLLKGNIREAFLESGIGTGGL